MNKNTEWIDQYLHGRMNPTEKEKFEAQLKSDPSLQKELLLQQQLMTGLTQLGLINELKSGLKKGQRISQLKRWLLFTVAISLTVFGVIFLKNNFWPAHEKGLRYQLNEEGTTQWADADRHLKSQIFTVNTERDTIIETRGGIIFALAANSFLDVHGQDVKGEIEVEVKEALTPFDVVKAGLSTVSEGRLLETGGMFYINARQDGKNLTLPFDKNIGVNIPDLQKGKEMQLFKGQRTATGSIDWVNPQSFEKYLNTVNISDLDFYPPGFIDTLQAMGFDIKNKQLTDSIYYSFFCGAGPAQPVGQSDRDLSDSIEHASLSVRPPHIKPNGELLFKKNCAVCHSTSDQKLTGPGLAGIMARVPSHEWLVHYILDNETMIKAGDPYANKIYEENGKAAMTVFDGQLSIEDVNAIIGYIAGIEPMLHDEGSSACEIDPSRVRAIWHPRFNHTLLATKAFEKRLKAIFGTCNHSILDLYINNMDKRMYQIDSMASRMLGESPGSKEPPTFYNFYLQREGRVPGDQPHLKKLQAWMEEKRNEYMKQVRVSLEKMYKKERELDENARQVRDNSQNKEANRIGASFQQELDLNMDEAYRQLGKIRPKVPPFENNFLSAAINTAGWYNVDRYVIESTVNRSTLDFTDTETGKKAVIKYEKLNVRVDNAVDFDRCYAYLIPDRLSCFQRMKGTSGLFNENLNELIHYSVLVAGFRGDKLYGAKIATAKPGEFTVHLEKMDPAAFGDLGSGSSDAIKEVVEDLNFHRFEEKEEQRQKKIIQREAIRARLWRIVFPCAGYESELDGMYDLN